MGELSPRSLVMYVSLRHDRADGWTLRHCAIAVDGSEIELKSWNWRHGPPDLLTLHDAMGVISDHIYNEVITRCGVQMPLMT